MLTILPANVPKKKISYYRKDLEQKTGGLGKPMEHTMCFDSDQSWDYEFWWCTNNLAKGLWRGEILYVHDMADAVVRKQLDKMLCWKAGVRSDFCVSVGKSSKYLYKWLDGNEYRQYLDTFFAGDISGAWSAVLKMCDLFEKTALFVAEELGYTYNRDEAAAARGFLEHVKGLPENAEEIF